jgi:DNA-binding CsgD family transcriptional regulator/tetratricopeptide (TPR) repeat protein
MGRISCPAFIDRVEESAVLDAALERAKTGATPTVFVGGEAGIGKSRLVAEFSRRASEDGARVLTGACAPFSRGPPPFTPVIEALRTLMRAADAAERAELVKVAPALTWLLPELAVDGASWRKLEGFESGQSWVFALVLNVLEHVAAERPLVVLLEDLHWSDRSTLDLLALRLQTERVPGGVVVATYRSDELASGNPLRLLLAELDRTGRADRLELRRFARAELIAQLTGILGRTPSYETVEDIVGRSDGNPFLAEELLAARSDSRAGTPTRVQEIVLARVETLSEPAQQLLRVLAAARRSLAHDTVAAVADLRERELEGCLREALGRHVLVSAPGGGYAFRHALMREAIYDRLLVSERERIHLDLARVLETHQGPVTPELLADRAHHWYSAGDRARALASAVEAGLAVDEIYAHAEALTQYERALELWDRVDNPERLAGTDRVALRSRAAEAAACLGDMTRAVRLIECALEDVDPVAEPVRAGLMRERLGRYSWIGGDAAGALEAYEDAVRVIPDAPPSAERARAITALGHAQFVSCRYRAAEALCAEALGIARALGARAEEGRALTTLGAATAGLGDGPDGVGMVREGRALLERAGAAPDFIFVTYACESDVLAAAGDFEAAAETTRPGIDMLRRHGMHRSHQAWLEGRLAAALIKLGRWAQADPILDAALLRGPTGITRRMLQLLRAELGLARGDLATAETCLAEARSAARGDQPFTGKLFEIAAGLALARRDYPGAHSNVANGLAALEPLDDVQATAWLCWRGLEAQAEQAQRARARRHVTDAEAALEIANGLLDRARALAGLHGARSVAELPALLQSCQAEAARATGRPAAHHWLAAAEGWESLREPYPRAQCLVRGAEAALAERHPRTRIATTLTAAHEIADRLGAAPLAGALESIARRARIAIATPIPPPAEPVRETDASTQLGLTPREIQVLTLVGHGYTNGQIADSLFISRKTAGAHVSNILAKLGVSRRAEAGAIAERLELVSHASTVSQESPA